MLATYLHYGNGSLIVATSELLCVCCTAVRSLTACEVDLSSPAVCAELLWVVIARGGGGIPEIGVVKLVEL